MTGSKDGSTKWMSLLDLYNVNLHYEKKFFIYLKFPPLPDSVVYRSFKIMPRATNCHAIVDAAFQINVDKDNKHTVQELPILAFGGINSYFVSIFSLFAS